jgi:hypothetical protein
VTEITFKREELRLIQDHKIFGIKAIVTSKINSFFLQIQEGIISDLKTTPFQFPDKILLRSGKISKGENYQNCPYLVLDFPRLFSRKDIFSYRTIFWWGHYFSNAIILGGISYHHYIDKFNENIIQLKNKDWYLCVYKNPWKLEKDTWNYIPFNQLSSEKILEILNSKNFIKIAHFYSLQEPDKWYEGTRRFLSDLLQLMGR